MILNPVAQVIQDARFFVITDQSATVYTLYSTLAMYLVPLAITAGLAVVGVIYFKKKSPGFAEEI
jgi:ABC-2 type transport system permease protein